MAGSRSSCDPHDLGNGLTGDVVLGRPESAAHDHPVAAGQRRAQAPHDPSVVVPHRLVEVRVTPDAASCSPNHAEFVSAIWPSSSSVPTATISILMAAPPMARRPSSQVLRPR